MRGQIAKDKVTEIIIQAFGKDFICIQDKKIFVQQEEDGEKVQVCLSLTCPKVPISVGGEDGGINFNTSISNGAPDVFSPAEITDKEMENVRNLIKELGL